MLIGIMGAARSGKDTIATHLKYKYGFIPYSFATPLKDVVGDLFDLSHDQLYGELKEVIDPRYDKSPRWLLQYIGTDVFRKLYPNCWVDKGVRMYRKRLEEDGEVRMVIPDVRFRNEFDAIKEAGGHVWKTVRTDHHGASGGIEGHPSEVEMQSIPDKEIDMVVSAVTGELGKLYEAADWFLINKLEMD